MFKITPIFRPFHVIETENGRSLHERPIDQFNSEDFNLSSNGFPANDITLLLRASTQKEFDLIASRLQEIKVSQPDNKGKSDKQLVAELMPSWIQFPAEIDRFMDYFNGLHPVAAPIDHKTGADIVSSVENPSSTE